MVFAVNERRSPADRKSGNSSVGCAGPVVANSDYMSTVADQIRAYVPGYYRVLGTDGFGRSDARARLRDFFEVDRRYVVIAALKALADEGELEASKVSEAIAKYGIDTERPYPPRM